MKRSLALLVLGLVGMVQPGLAVDKEVIQLQQNVALLLGMVRELQRSFDERIVVIRTLVEQSSDRMNQFSDRVNQVNSGLAELQKSMQNSVGNAGQKVDNLGNQMQGLQASMEELRVRLDKLSQQVTKLESSSQTISGSGFSTSAEPGMGTPPAPDVLYNTALRDYTSGNYPLALQEFLEYLRYYSNAALASNAQFYIGDIYYQQGQFEKAVQEYDKAIEQYPDGNKSATAQYKKGLALLNQNLRTQGVQELNALIQKFPTTPEAQMAKDKLANLPPDSGRRSTAR